MMNGTNSMWEKTVVISLRVLTHASLGGTPMMLLEAFQESWPSIQDSNPKSPEFK
jgi:hypothetical protein